jgi:hypothetical protein
MLNSHPNAMRTVSKLRVFLASPGDVPDERHRVETIIDQLNRGIADEKGLVLDLIRWETHSWPSAGSDPQEIINRQVGVPEIFIGIMWTRLGTKTPRAESGTVEEFELAFESWRNGRVAEIMFYIRTDPFYPSTEEEISAIRKGPPIQEPAFRKWALLSRVSGWRTFI